jgi:hypothetical protein
MAPLSSQEKYDHNEDQPTSVPSTVQVGSNDPSEGSAGPSDPDNASRPDPLEDDGVT